LLGMENIYAPRIDPEDALDVFETPKDWLIGGRSGVCIVDPARAASILRNAEPLRVTSAEFGLRLGALINLRPPRILTPTVAVQRAVA
jgi:hypothetical protein